MRKFLWNLNRFLRRIQGHSLLQNYENQQEKFKAAYPNYSLGIGTYGFPFIHDDGEGGLLRIGAYCSISSEVQIFLGKNHRMDWISTYPFPAFFKEACHIREFNTSKGDIIIGNDVWLCANSIILSGVKIGDGAVIGAGAVVSHNVEPYSVVAGNPAKHVRWRFDEATRLALLEVRWWDWPISELLSIMDIICSAEIQNLINYANNRKDKNINTNSLTID